MTRRPDPFNQAKLEEALLQTGCPESSLSSTVSNYRLFVPLVLAELGEDRVFEIVEQARDRLGLGEQTSAWRSSVKYLVAWAEAAIEDYRARHLNQLEETPRPSEPEQPRLL
ncbi:MAG: hypothetical protein GXY36_08900 [Chloroflexi bacterium]|jgi:hypothetical protein|nr:hypothetical protein [Chloroflexota bacterium]